MRGKAVPAALPDVTHGITPAYAGKRMLVGEYPKPLWDHPRVCGEKFLKQVESLSYLGSPPRMRGKDSDGGQRASASRITPAYAGKS